MNIEINPTDLLDLVPYQDILEYLVNGKSFLTDVVYEVGSGKVLEALDIDEIRDYLEGFDG